MTVLTYIPKPPLSEFVDLFWLHKGAGGPPGKERLLPTGAADLVISLREDRLRIYDSRRTGQFQSFSAGVFCGPRSEPSVIDAASGASVLGVHFKPGGVFAFLKIPVNEFHNAHVSLDAAWDLRAADLRDQLLETQSAEDRFGIVERFLLSKLAPSKMRHVSLRFALNELEKAPHGQKIGAVVERIGISHKRFIATFKGAVGLTPKQYCRVQRFGAVLRLLERRIPVNWAHMAIACGYYDQSHLVNEFQEFSGLSPTAYMRQRGQWSHHVPLAG